MAAEKPGTPATVSRKMHLVRTSRSSSVLRVLPMVYPEARSNPILNAVNDG